MEREVETGTGRGRARPLGVGLRHGAGRWEPTALWDVCAEGTVVLQVAREV